MKNIYQIFYHFFYLGCISFGGPAAHLNYFQQYFVGKLQWVSLSHYSRLVALSQFLPGPGSSQVGFALGYHQAGICGAIAAFVGFTLPSFILLFLLAVLGMNFADSASFVGAVYGLKLLAVVIVGDAVISMSKVFCQKKVTKLIALVVMVSMLVMPHLILQLSLLVIAGLVGMFTYKTSLIKAAQKATDKKNDKVRIVPLIVFFILLFGLPLLAGTAPLIDLFNSFYQSGSLVFGGGHVVLPLLQQSITEPLTNDVFLLGYASAQAVPGPMFTLATFLGANLYTSMPLVGALVATVAIFLPGFLLILSLQFSWQKLAYQPQMSGIITGVNAAVVGLLGAAFYQPVAMNAIYSWLDIVWVCSGFILLKVFRLPILVVVACFIALGILLTL